MRLSFFPAVTRAVAVRNPYQAHTESGGAIVTFLIDGGHVFARGNLEHFLKDFVFDIPRAAGSASVSCELHAVSSCRVWVTFQRRKGREHLCVHS